MLLVLIIFLLGVGAFYFYSTQKQSPDTSSTIIETTLETIPGTQQTLQTYYPSSDSSSTASKTEWEAFLDLLPSVMRIELEACPSAPPIRARAMLCALQKVDEQMDSADVPKEVRQEFLDDLISGFLLFLSAYARSKGLQSTDVLKYDPEMRTVQITSERLRADLRAKSPSLDTAQPIPLTNIFPLFRGMVRGRAKGLKGCKFCDNLSIPEEII